MVSLVLLWLQQLILRRPIWVGLALSPSLPSPPPPPPPPPSLLPLSFSLSLSLSLAANFSIAEYVLRWLLRRSGRGDALKVLHNAAINLVQARREENKSTKVHGDLESLSFMLSAFYSFDK